ncbi:hypothetical protein PAPYR_326 [Paratrimastix pyriformis]|uniref:DUF4083 domain-containing protein n=1 Tax=Paratrimastix pyriformis TaxID=342808 RepID=A0ABQ8UWV9_9EUKA|nr:hypothetical protein PAPYR_326 [Paratrimastix pyriformis]
MWWLLLRVLFKIVLWIFAILLFFFLVGLTRYVFFNSRKARKFVKELKTMQFTFQDFDSSDPDLDEQRQGGE